MYKTKQGRRKSEETFSIIYGLQDGTQSHTPQISISLEGLSETKEWKALYFGDRSGFT